MRPLTVLALCCVIAVLSVAATQAVLNRGTSSTSAAATRPDDGQVTAPSDNGPTDAPDDESDSPSDGASPTVIPSTQPVAPGPGAAPPPVAPPPVVRPPGPAAGPPSPTTGPTTGPTGGPPSSPPGSLPPPVTRVYEAEWVGNSFTNTTVYTCSGCSGQKKVGRVGRNSGTLQFNGITATTGGLATVKIAYVNGDTAGRVGWLSINGSPGVPLDFDVTGGWSTVHTLVVIMTLKAGGNTLAFFNDDGPAPDFDKLTVSVR